MAAGWTTIIVYAILYHVNGCVYGEGMIIYRYLVEGNNFVTYRP